MKKFLTIFALFATFTITSAQENTQFFGYIQPLYFHYQSDQDYWSKVKFNSGGVSQANFFLTSEFKNDLSAFVNFELINNYSSDKKWGAFNLQEAYLKWAPNTNFNLKFGQIIPQFNSFFEIYNRTPIIPYLIRPKVYEATSGNLVDIFDILPQKALLHINGTQPFDDIKLDYAAYINHAVNKFHSNPNNDLLPYYAAYGQSATERVGYGGRLGMRYKDNLKLGVSGTIDYENRHKFKWNENGDIADLGEFRRTRIGADLEIKFAGFTLSGEYMQVRSNLDNKYMMDPLQGDSVNILVKDFLKKAYDNDAVFIGNSLDKDWMYLTLQYNPTPETFVYAMYDKLNDKTDPYYFGKEGFYGITLGGGYNVNDNVVLKAQVIKNFCKFDNPPLIDGEPSSYPYPNKNYVVTDYTEMYFVLGASISF